MRERKKTRAKNAHYTLTRVDECLNEFFMNVIKLIEYSMYIYICVMF